MYRFRIPIPPPSRRSDGVRYTARLAAVPLLLLGAGSAAPLAAQDSVPRVPEAPPPLAVPAGHALALPFPGLIGPAADAARAGVADTVGLLDDLFDLGLRFTGRAELGGDWTRFTPCAVRVETTCDPSMLPTLRPDLQVGIRVGGTVAERVEVEVDWDQTREFSASNTINIVYNGEAGEPLRRVEVGDVSFGLPPSRFLTEGIPRGNFGVQAEGDLGPLGVRAVWAQQRGDLSSRVFRLSEEGGELGFVQEDTLRLDDADYASGQFFFLVHPTRLRGYPHLDALSMNPSAAPPEAAPGAEPIQLYRYEVDPVTLQQVEGFIQADAGAGLGSDTVVVSGWFRYLQPGRDYTVHSSGLWIALRVPLRAEEMLAVTFVTAAGDTVGDYNPERIHNAGGRPRLRLLRAGAGDHQPGRPTWESEMHQVYRISTSDDVDAGSLGLTVSLGERAAGRTFRRLPDGREITFLSLLGMDREAPRDELDRARVWQPAAESFMDEPPVRGTFLVFPTLRPFLEPPPDPGAGLDDEEARELLGDDANARIYESEDPFVRASSGLFRLTVPFTVRSRGVISSFSLGALGIRGGSERIHLGERLLERGVDYRIDYDLGQVTLTEPGALFLTTRDPVIRATWEQRALFQLSPVSIVGVNAHYDVGERGRIDLVGLWQGEEAVVRRPQLGIEPASVFLAGLSSSLRFPLDRFDGWLDDLSWLRTRGSSSLGVRGELAVSVPDPNTQGAVFLDDFDAAGGARVSLREWEWRLGSAPSSDEGAAGLLPPGPDPASAAGLVWQHRWIVQGASGDSLGVHEGFFPGAEIDRQINVLGSPGREPGLRMTLGGDLPFLFDRRRGRSITTVLAPNGMDLSRTEFLEFYATAADSAVLVIDLGVVSEDAFFIDDDGRTSGTKPTNGEPWGLGLLDQEADPRRGEVWSDLSDLLGVWGETCLGGRSQVFPVGDRRANCNRGNGRRDSEDLDGDGNLDTGERLLRWVVPLDGESPFLVRDRSETGTTFRLYRIPLRGGAATPVGGEVTEADRRSVRHLRLTLTSTRRSSVTVARMTLSGSRWVKRTLDGVARGMVGDTAGSGGPVEVTSVSRLTEGPAYVSPPGVLEELDDPSAAAGGQGVEFNEKSLGIRYEGLPSGQRVEVYDRFPQTPRDFLSYRELRLWVLARRGDWGGGRPVYFFLKVGSDDENFYLYRTRLEPAADPGGTTVGDWLPEVVVDVERWLALRRLAEEALVRDPRAPGDPPLEVWSPDSAYAVVLRDRARAPNLASVREVALGVWNGDAVPVEGEVWIDELRLDAALREPGVAGHVDIDLSAGDAFLGRFTHTRRGGHFRQLETGPTFRTDRVTTARGTVFLDRFTPEGWGLEMPLTVSHERVAEDPIFLPRSDVRADRLDRLRPTASRRTRVDLVLRRRPDGAPSGWSDVLLDGVEVRAGWFSSEAGTVVFENRAGGLDARVGWSYEPRRRTIPLVPEILGSAVRTLLPSGMAESALSADVRWSPSRIRISTGYVEQENRIRRFEEVLRLAGDSAVRPVNAPRQEVEAGAEVDFRPVPSLTAGLTFLSLRDLLSPDELVDDPALRPLVGAERRRVAGIDLGWETRRSLRTDVAFRPRPFSWLETDFHWGTVFDSDRNATFVGEEVREADTVPRLERNVLGGREARATVTLDPEAVAAAYLPAGPGGRDTGGPTADRDPDGSAVPRDPDGPEVPRDESWVDHLAAGLSVIRPIRATWQDGITARFDRESIRPGMGYQLGWGGASAFRFLGADTASTLTDRTAVSVGSGLDLPGGVGVEVGYTRALSSTLDTRSDRERRDRTWPDLRITFPDLPVPPGLDGVLEGVRVSTGYRRTVQGLEFGAAAQQGRFAEDRRVPVDVSVEWAGGVRTLYRGALGTGEGTDPTGRTERRQGTHLLSVISTVGAHRISPLESPLRLAVSLHYDAQDECRRTAGTETCTPYVDRVNRAIELRIDTEVSRMDVGLQVAWTDRQSYVGVRPGSTQFRLDLFGRFELEAGDPRLLAPGRPGL